jgi:hypothetical protein
MTSPHDGHLEETAALGVATPALSRAAGRRPGVPLTERILSRLPGPRLAWILLWASTPWLNLLVIVMLDAGEWASTGGIPVGEVLNRTAVSCAVVVSLWGATRISDQLRRLGATLADVVDEDERDIARLFRGVDSTVAPLLLTAVGVWSCPSMRWWPATPAPR